MTVTKTARSLVVCFLLIGLLTGSTSAQRKKQIAVLDFDFATVDLGLADRAYGGRQNLARRVAEKLVTSLVGLGTCQVIERSQLEKVLREQNLGTEGRIDASTAAKVGQILGVDALVIGSVSIFELLGVPKPNDPIWDNKKMSSRIGVNFRVINTTTAVVELSNEQIGASSTPPKSKSSDVGKKLGGFIGGLGNKNNEPKDEEIRDVVQQALEDTVAKITVDIEKYLSGASRAAEPTIAPDKQIAGAIIEANGPSLIITGIRKGAVRMGDRLYVRRAKVRVNPTNNQQIRYSEKIGEVEVVEIQDEVIIGSFTGSGKAEVGDTVTNNPTGAAATPAMANVTTTTAPAPGPTNPPRNTSPSTHAPNSARTTNSSAPTVAPPAPTVAPPAAPVAPTKQERKLIIPATQSWSDTGIDVQPGMPLELVATGLIKISATREVPASGLAGRPAPATSPMPGSNIGVLLYRVRYADGQISPTQVVGARSNLTLPKAGRLELGINDSDVKDNTGSFTVTVRW